MAKLSETFTYNKGGNLTAPPSLTSQLNTQTNTQPKLSEIFSYDINVPHNEPKISAETKIPTQRDFGKLVNEYESLPSTDFLSRVFSKESREAYKKKQELNPLYEQGKDMQTKDLLAQYGIADSDIMRQSGNSQKENKRITSLLKEKGITDKATIDAIKAYSERLLNEKVDTNVTEYSKEDPVHGTLLSGMLKVASDVPGTLQNTYDFFKGNALSSSKGANAMTKTVGNMRDAMTEDMGKVGKFAYGVGTSIMDMAPILALGGAGGLGYAGVSAAQGSMPELIDRGLSPRQIMFSSVANGVAEAALEKLPLGNLEKWASQPIEKTFKSLAKVVGSQMASEGIEEMGTDVINFITDRIINGDKSQYNIDKKKYGAKTALLNFIKQTVYDGLAGATSGGLMGGGASAYNVSRNGFSTPSIPTLQQNNAVETQTAQPTHTELPTQTEQPTVAEDTLPTSKESQTEIDKKLEELRKEYNLENAPQIAKEEAVKKPTVYNDYEIVTVHRKNGKEAYVPKGVSDNGTLYSIHKAVSTKEQAQQIIEDHKKNQVMAEDIGLNKKTNAEFEAENNLSTLEEKPTIARGYAEPIGDTLTQEYRERGYAQHVRGEDTPMKVEGLSEEVVNDFRENPRMYAELKNANTKALADEIYQSGDKAIKIGNKTYGGTVEEKFRTLLAEKNPASLPLGHQIAKDYQKAGNHEMAVNIIDDISTALTESGQFSQAAAISMMMNDPLTALQYAKKQIDAINREGQKKFGDKWNNFSLTEDEIEAFNNIEDGDGEAIKKLYDQIGQRLGKEYPTTFMEKLLEGRKVAMLFNVRTNVRNFGANVPTLGLRWMADRVEALGQNIAHLINPNFEVTQSVTGSGAKARKLAKEVFNSDRVNILLDGDVGKYEVPELKNALMKDRQMYKGTRVSKWINKMTNGGIEKVNEKLFGKKGVESLAETIRNATYKALELGDNPFVKENFVERLGSYIKAQGITNIEDVPDEAIQTAWEEAMKATYKDNSWAVNMLRKIKSGMESVPVIGKPLSQATIPFLQAPGNIAARMVDYSPIRGTKGVYDIIKGSKTNNESLVRRGIEEAAKGLTGTGLILLGMALKGEGLITGDYSDDKDEKNFQKAKGFKPWALHVGDKYFTYDWAQPFAQNLMVGTLLAEAIENSDKEDDAILKAVAYEGPKAAVNSWFSASPLQGLADLMKGNGYSGEVDIAENFKSALTDDFIGAMVPSLVNATAKTMDTTQRNYYDPTSKVNTFINLQKSKIPSLSKELPAKYDTWGREITTADSTGEAFLQRFFVPGDSGTDKNDKIDNEIQRLFTATENNAVFPQTAPNKVDKKALNNEEVSKYQKDMGTRSRKLVEAFMKSDAYKSMSDDSKAEVLGQLYGMSKVITERDLFKKPVNENSSYKNAIKAYDSDGGKNINAVIDYYNDKATLNEFKKGAAGLRSDGSSKTMDKKELAVYLYGLGYDLDDINEWLVKNGAKNGYTESELMSLIDESEDW